MLMSIFRQSFDFSSCIVRVISFLYVCGCWDPPSPAPLCDMGQAGMLHLITLYLWLLLTPLLSASP